MLSLHFKRWAEIYISKQYYRNDDNLLEYGIVIFVFNLKNRINVGFIFFSKNRYSIQDCLSAAAQIPLSRSMLGLNQGLLRL
jgi:hypothetical protein